MRPIPPAPAPGQRILLIPAMLDAHFPLLQYAFHSKAYYPVILSQSRGLRTWACAMPTMTLCYPLFSAWVSISRPWAAGPMTWTR